MLGHISRDCPSPRKPLKCLTCGLEGHTSKYCKTQNTTVNVVGQNSNIKRYVKQIIINNSKKVAQGLIDTGCDICLIRLSTAVNYQLMIAPAKRRLTVYGNVESNVVCGTTIASITIDGVTKVVHLWVVNDEAQ